MIRLLALSSKTNFSSVYGRATNSMADRHHFVTYINNSSEEEKKEAGTKVLRSVEQDLYAANGNSQDEV